MATKDIVPVIVICGPTASGKTGLSLKLAREYGGEILCADSRTVYKGMDIGTAKPSDEEQNLIPHWGLDLVEPGAKFSAYDFQQYAYKKIDEIYERGAIPFLVGGTGLYIDAVVQGYLFKGGAVDENIRGSLEKQSLEDLQYHCKKNNISLPENYKNKRYIINNILRKNQRLINKKPPKYTFFIVGISTEKDTLRTRIIHRSEQLFQNGMVEEAKTLGKKYGWSGEAMTGNIYRLVKKQLDGEIQYDELKDKFIASDWQLAKRQLTWLRRSEYIQWGSLSEVEKKIRQAIENCTHL